MASYRVIILLISFNSGCSEKDASEDKKEEVPERIPMVFALDIEGYACYRVPSFVVTKSGTLLAFCEGRLNDCEDEGYWW